MAEHTALAGQFAAAFGNARFAPVAPRELMLYLVAHHDHGWQALDGRPPTDPRTGLPFNLVETPLPKLLETSAASPDFNARQHAWCGLLSSMHSWGLYNGRYGLSDKVLIDGIPAEHRGAADRMLDAELARQQALKAILAADPATAPWIDHAHLLQSYKQLQFFDTLALYFNRSHAAARETSRFEHVPVDARDDCTVEIRPGPSGVYAISPNPFATEHTEFSYAGRVLEPCMDATLDDWESVFATTPTVVESFQIVAA